MRIVAFYDNRRLRWIMFRNFLAAAALGAALAPVAVSAAPITFSYTGALQTYIVPADGHYELMAYGAQGGDHLTVASGGLGAQIGGDFLLTAGTTLNIVVGGQGGARGGGGGGSFIYTLANELLVAAGGGGGGGPSGGGGPGQTGTSGQDGMGLYPGAGGTAGNGGAGSPWTFFAGGGGGGWLSDGGNGAAGSAGFGGAGAPSFAGGAGQDIDGLDGGVGGYGGGGGAGKGPAPGGGGGYSGGGGSSDGGGGGGGSFLSALATDTLLISGARSGNGSVVITFLDVENVPEPASMSMMAAGIAGLGALRRRGPRGWSGRRTRSRP